MWHTRFTPPLLVARPIRNYLFLCSFPYYFEVEVGSFSTFSIGRHIPVIKISIQGDLYNMTTCLDGDWEQSARAVKDSARAYQVYFVWMKKKPHYLKKKKYIYIRVFGSTKLNTVHFRSENLLRSTQMFKASS